jgi:hypothetical protein
MSDQSDITHARASVVENSARACREAFDAWIAQPGRLRRETLEGLMRGHEMDHWTAMLRENAELKATLEAMRAEKVRIIPRVGPLPKLRVAVPVEE